MFVAGTSRRSEPQEQTAQDFVTRHLMIHENMKRRRDSYNGLMDEAASMFTPELYMRDGTILDPGRRFAEDMFDTTGMLALTTWSRGIPGNMVYDKAPWFRLEINVPDLMAEPEVRWYCEQRTEQVVYGLRRTNFYRDNAQFCRYAGAVGGYWFPMVNRASRSIYFYLEDPFYVWVERDIMGKLLRCHREFTLTVEALAQEFGLESLDPNHQMLLGTANANHLRDVNMLHGIFVNPGWEAGALDATRKPFVEFYIDVDNKHLVYHNGCDYLPVNWCVERAPRGAYPLTPAMFALTDAYGADTLSKSLYRVALEAGDPEMRVAKTLMSRYLQGAGQINYVDDRERDFIEQTRKTLNWPVGDRERQTVQERIDLWFSTPYWRMLAMISQNATPPTAYQLREVAAEKATMLGPQTGTYTADVLDTSVDIVSELEAQYDPVPMPDILQEYLLWQAQSELQRLGYSMGDEEAVLRYARQYPAAYMEAQYSGALTAIQSQVTHARKYGDGLSALAGIVQFWPEAAHIVNPYPLTRNILVQQCNWSQEEVKSQKQYEELVRTLQEQEDLQQLAEQEQASAKAYKQLTRAPEEGSPAARQMEAK